MHNRGLGALAAEYGTMQGQGMSSAACHHSMHILVQTYGSEADALLSGDPTALHEELLRQFTLNEAAVTMAKQLPPPAPQEGVGGSRM